MQASKSDMTQIAKWSLKKTQVFNLRLLATPFGQGLVFKVVLRPLFILLKVTLHKQHLFYRDLTLADFKTTAGFRVIYQSKFYTYF